MSWRRRIGSVLLILGVVGAAWETFYVFRTGGHWHTDLVMWFVVLGFGWWFHSGPVAKGRWRRGVGICLAMVGAVGTILWLKIAAAGVSYVPFAGSLVTLGFGAWLLRSAVHANGDDRRHLRPQVPLTSGRATVRTGDSMWWALRQPMG